MYLAPESAKLAICQHFSRVLVNKERSSLRIGRDRRRARIRLSRVGRWFAQPMLTIHERGFDSGDRSDLGRWEGDLIVSPHRRPAIRTLVERNTRYLRLVHLGTFIAVAVNDSLVRMLGQLPTGLRMSLKWDQGCEMVRLLDITDETRTNTFVTGLVFDCGQQMEPRTATPAVFSRVNRPQ